MISAMVDLLAGCYQAGNLDQMEAIARSLLAAIPEDTVALQFLGLALYLGGRLDDARLVFLRAVAPPRGQPPATTCEQAREASLRLATRPGSGLAGAWVRIAGILRDYGLREAARRARRAAVASSLDRHG
ncbi:MAG TPA: hypothetical protein PKD29_05800 [Rhodocyclaceae bacterium]|nr:hypothetical protein [Rhodocyclaceae bacterium]